MQSELRLMGLIDRTRRDLPFEEIIRCSTEQDALRLCMKNHPSQWDDYKIAEAIGIDASALNRVLNSDRKLKEGNKKACRWMSRTTQIALQDECGNNAPAQWEDAYKKRQLICQRKDHSLDEEEAMLEAKLAQIRAMKKVT